MNAQVSQNSQKGQICD